MNKTVTHENNGPGNQGDATGGEAVACGRIGASSRRGARGTNEVEEMLQFVCGVVGRMLPSWRSQRAAATARSPPELRSGYSIIDWVRNR